MGDVNKCPKCGFEDIQTKFSVCPKCGVIIYKYYQTEEKKPAKLVSQSKERSKTEENALKDNNMKYIDIHLMPGEQILHRGYMHKMPIIIYSLAIAPIMLILFILLIALNSKGFAYLILIAWIGSIVMLRLALKRTEMAVTNKRVIIKKGIFATRSLELIISKIESVVVDKGLIGNMFDYGDVMIIGSGGTKELLKWVKSPVDFRNAVNQSLSSTMS